MKTILIFEDIIGGRDKVHRGQRPFSPLSAVFVVSFQCKAIFFKNNTRNMTVKTILRLTVAFLVSSSAFGDLRGDGASICRRTVSRRESRYVPYAETFKQKVWGSSFRIRTRTNFKEEYHVLYTTEAVCCDGYENSGGICTPVCDNPCENGKCVKPNLCECDSGYVLDFFGRCIPVCAIPCEFGECTAPETCTCENGYALKTHKYTCEPVCSPTCNNGYCSGPNICSCNPGYERNDDNECDAICERTCVNGKCVAPDVCNCDDGFQPSEDDVFSCDPVCSNHCVFGSCTAPGICTCNQGYAMTKGSNFTCEPICNQTCKFGDCIAPDTCSCNDGYALTSESQYICQPVCEEDCINGNCVAPEVCECLEGHIKSIGVVGNGTKCDPHCDHPCNNGDCTAPNFCSCDSGFRFNYTTLKCDPVCTKPCINGFCESPDTCMCEKGYAKSSENSETCEAVCENCGNGFCEAPGICICNEGFIKDEVDNGTCISLCKPDCQNGVCSATGCVCDSGWGGDFCGKSLVCVLSKPLEDTLFEAGSANISAESEELNNSQMIVENSKLKLDRPVCNQRCFEEVKTGFTVNKTSTNEIRYFFPVDSPCNISPAQTTASKTSVNIIGAVIGTALCAVFVYLVYLVLVRIMRNRRTAIGSSSRECIYKEEPDDYNVTNSWVDNMHSL